MKNHISDQLLSAFVQGDMDEPIAVQVALHLDSCPSCATRAATFEPLAPAFASVRDPVPPRHLAEDALAVAAQPDRSATLEVAVGALLLAAAALLAVLAGDLVGTAARLGVVVDALGTASTHLAGNVTFFGASMPLMLLAAQLPEWRNA